MLFLVENTIWPILIITFLIFAILRPVMFKPSLIRFIIYSSIPLLFLMLAEGVVLISGNFDLSIGQMTGFIAISSGVILENWGGSLPFPTAIFVPLFLGLLCGALNGFLVGRLRLNAFISTLGTYLVFRGSILLVSTKTILPSAFPSYYLALCGSTVSAIVFGIGVLAILAIVLRFTPFGLRIYGVGGSPESSRMLGINVGKVVFFAYVIAGILCGLSAIAYTGFQNAVPPSTADGAMFLAFAGAVIGGIAIRGGRGSLVNVVGGALFLGVIEAGLTMFAISPFLRTVVYGILVIAAIVINTFRDSIRDRLLMPK